jgi:CRP-like cAMP-binding protein
MKTLPQSQGALDEPALLHELTAHPFLRGMTPHHLQTLAHLAMPVSFETGDVIFSEGEPANRFFLIQSGSVALESDPGIGETVHLQTIGAGEVLGWSWLFPPYYWHFAARAVEPTRAIFLYGARLRELCETDHHLGYDLMKRTTEVVIQRLQATREKLLEVVELSR